VREKEKELVREIPSSSSSPKGCADDEDTRSSGTFPAGISSLLLRLRLGEERERERRVREGERGAKNWLLAASVASWSAFSPTILFHCSVALRSSARGRTRTRASQRERGVFVRVRPEREREREREKREREEPGEKRPKRGLNAS